MKIGLIGLWHLGSVSAGGWTTLGVDVVAWDSDEALRRQLAGGRAPVAEPGLDEALATALGEGRLVVTASASAAVEAAPITYLAYDSEFADVDDPRDARLEAAVETFASAAPDGALLLVSSQLTVGTCRRWRERLDAAGRGLAIAHAPENLRLGRALADFLEPSRLVVGADDDASFGKAMALLDRLATPPLRVGLSAAELVKHATNAYLGMCVAFANDLAWLSLGVGADPAEVSEGFRADPRVAPTAPLRPGTAFSGATLTRDLRALRRLGGELDRAELFDAIIASNDRHAYVGVDWLELELGSLEGRTIAVAGLTYKPGTSTLRDSLPLRVVRALGERSASIAAWDPLAESFDPPSGVVRAESLAAATDGADALLVTTALPELRNTDWAALRPARRLVIDTCGGVDRASVEAAGWEYRGFGA